MIIMVSKRNLINLAKRIKEETKDQESYNTGLVGEMMIIGAYKTMPIEKLEKLRFILNKIIKQKKEYKRFNESKSDNINTDNT